MCRRLTIVLTLTLVAAACSGSSDEGRVLYFQEAAQISSTYEVAAGTHFEVYRTALEAATPETGDDIYVDASLALFASLAPDLEVAVAGLASLTPPDEVETEHDAWLSSARALNTAIQDTNGDLASLTEAEAVAEALSTVNLDDLQESYRSACRSVRQLAVDSEGVIACEPGETT